MKKKSNTLNKQEKSYLDILLENKIKETKQKRLTQEEINILQQAVIDYKSEKTNLNYQRLLPFFQHMYAENLKRFFWEPDEDVWYNYQARMLEKIDKYNSSAIGRNGAPILAYSYFSTISKCFMLQAKLKEQKRKTINANL